MERTAVFTLMPGLLVLFSNLMMKTKHRNLVPKIPFVGRFAYATRKIIPPVFLVVIAAGYFISQKCPYVYGYSTLKTPLKSLTLKCTHSEFQIITNIFSIRVLIFSQIPKNVRYRNMNAILLRQEYFL